MLFSCRLGDGIQPRFEAEALKHEMYSPFSFPRPLFLFAAVNEVTRKANFYPIYAVSDYSKGFCFQCNVKSQKYKTFCKMQPDL